MTENKGIVSSLDFTYYFPSGTLANGYTSSVQGIELANTISSLSPTSVLYSFSLLLVVRFLER